MKKRTDVEQLCFNFEITEREALHLLRNAGAVRLKRIAFRPNRSTIWSLTQNGTVLNLHSAYRFAPAHLLRCFAVIASASGRRSTVYKAACRAVENWSALEAAFRQLQSASGGSRRVRTVRCQGTPEEQRRFRRLYEECNQSVFAGRLPADVQLRISRRMKTRLGHVSPEGSRSRRRVGEMALNQTLFRAGCEHLLRETLLHEVAHIAAYLFEGDGGHGRAWRRWAVRLGCPPSPCISSLPPGAEA